MILADRDIKEAVKEGRIVIKPYEEKCVQPSTYDLHLEDRLLVFDNYEAGEIDVKKRVDVSRMVKIKDEGFVLHPGEFILGSTLEYIELPRNLAGQLEGKSSLGRLGLIIHATAGYVDPGWKGQLTVEMSNISRLPIRIYGGMKAAQICFMKMTREVEIPYGDKRLGSKYFGQKGPTVSKVYQNFGKDPEINSG